jgi:hypothetical protein
VVQLLAKVPDSEAQFLKPPIQFGRSRNSPAQKLFGFQGPPAAGLRLQQLPVPREFLSRLLRRHRGTLSRHVRSVLRGEVLEG